MDKNKSIYTPQFFFLCLSSFLFFASFNMIIPELPDYLESLGGAEYIGFYISLFTLTAGLSRPFSGKLADTVGRVPVMIFGAFVCFICGFLYPLTGTVFAFLALRMFHGFSTGFKPTGTSAYVADIVPVSRRGEGMGILSLCGSLGMAFGPWLGSMIANQSSLTVMFYSSSAAAILSIIVIFGMKETLEQRHRQRFSFSLLKLKRHEIFEPAVVAPCIVLLLTTFSYGAVLTLIPDLSEALGIKNKGLFFLFFTSASIFVRFFAGKVSDKKGRVKVLKVSALLFVISMTLIAFSSSIFMFLTGAIIFGFATGINSPTVVAWTTDLSSERHRGRGLATMYIALEAGIGFGAFFSGWIYGNKTENFVYAFGICAILSLLALFYLYFGVKEKKMLAA